MVFNESTCIVIFLQAGKQKQDWVLLCLFVLLFSLSRDFTSDRNRDNTVIFNSSQIPRGY